MHIKNLLIRPANVPAPSAPSAMTLPFSGPDPLTLALGPDLQKKIGGQPVTMRLSPERLRKLKSHQRPIFISLAAAYNQPQESKVAVGGVAMLDKNLTFQFKHDGRWFTVTAPTRDLAVQGVMVTQNKGKDDMPSSGPGERFFLALEDNSDAPVARPGKRSAWAAGLTLPLRPRPNPPPGEEAPSTGRGE